MEVNFWGGMFMILVCIISFILSIVFFIDGACHTGEDGEETPQSRFRIKLCSICLFLSFVAIPLMITFEVITNNKPWITKQNQPFATEKIISLQDNNLMNGKFRLRSGYISEDLYYQYMVDIGDGWTVKNKVPASLTKVNPHENENPRVEWYREERGVLWYKEERTTFKIYIPDGSIIEDYNIDLN